MDFNDKQFLNMEQYELTFFTFSEQLNNLDTFLSNYNLDIVATCPEYRLNNLIKVKDRICRFCGKKSPETKFKSIAHIIPKMLGNVHYISDFECDNCNQKFSVYETDLSKFLGLQRTVMPVNKSKIPEIRSNKESVIAKQSDLFESEGIEISRKDVFDKSFSLDKETGTFQVVYDKQPYKPINVYKALLKIALSIIDKDDIALYSRTIKFVCGEYDDKEINFAKVLLYQVPIELSYSKPVCFLFKKVASDKLLPTHIFKFYFQNNVFEFPVPFNENDKMLGQVDITMCPPLFFSEPMLSYNTVQAHLLNLSSKELVYQKGILSFQMNPEAIKNAEAFDMNLKTTTKAELKGDRILKIILVPMGHKPNIFKDQSE